MLNLSDRTRLIHRKSKVIVLTLRKHCNVKFKLLTSWKSLRYKMTIVMFYEPIKNHKKKQ